MAVSRARFAGTHLENAPQYLLEIEAMASGGWGAKKLPKVKAPQRQLSRQDEKVRSGSITPTRASKAVPRNVRIGEPRRAPLPQSNERHHHFEQKTILASGKDGVSVAFRRAAYGEGQNLDRPIEGDRSRVTNEAEYGEGIRSTDAERVVYVTGTNGGTTAERLRFWKLANDHAHFVGEHSIAVSTHGVEALWDKASRDPTMPDELRETVASAKGSADGAARKVVNDAGITKRWLKRRSRSFPPELREHLKLNTPHNGRVAYSIIGQFPHDMSQAGMRGCLDALVMEFSKRSTPCQAVIHEPTGKNAIKNWHFHLMYYAGEAEKLEDGRWSFERVLKRNRHRTLENVPLKRMPRNPDIAKDDWIPVIKRRWSEIVNERAKTEGIATRFVNERNDERGLQKPQTRVTMGRHALNKQGYFTDREIADNMASWQMWRERSAAALTSVLEQPVSALKSLQRSPAAFPPAGSDKLLDEHMSRLKAATDGAALHLNTLAHASMLAKMIVSGPRATLAHYSDVIVNVMKKHSTARRRETIEFSETVCAASERHLDDIAPKCRLLGQIELKARLALIEARDEILTVATHVRGRLESLGIAKSLTDTKPNDVVDPARAFAAPRSADDHHVAPSRPERVDVAVQMVPPVSSNTRLQVSAITTSQLAPIPAKADENKQERRLEKLKSIDPWVSENDRGVKSIDEQILNEIGMHQEEMLSTSVQNVLTELSFSQERRSDAVLFGSNMHPIYIVDGKFSVVADFDPSLLEDMARWSTDRNFQSLVLSCYQTLKPWLPAVVPDGSATSINQAATQVRFDSVATANIPTRIDDPSRHAVLADKVRSDRIMQLAAVQRHALMKGWVNTRHFDAVPVERNLQGATMEPHAPDPAMLSKRHALHASLSQRGI